MFAQLHHNVPFVRDYLEEIIIYRPLVLMN